MQHKKWSSQGTYTNDPWTGTMVWGLPKGEGRLARGGNGGKIGTTVVAYSV